MTGAGRRGQAGGRAPGPHPKASYFNLQRVWAPAELRGVLATVFWHGEHV